MSAHYRDQMDRWRMIDYNTMLWDQVSVKKAAIETLILQPK